MLIHNQLFNRWRLCLLYLLPYAVVALSMVVYRAWFLPSMGLGWQYKTCFNLQHFVDVIQAGLSVSFSPVTLSFCAAMLDKKIKDGLSSKECFYLIALCGITFCGLNLTRDKAVSSTIITLLIVGLTILAFSYTVYGVSPEHRPAIDSWLNRVNMSAALGASITLACLLYFITVKLPIGSREVRHYIYAGLISVLAVAMVLVNWEFASPWIISCISQNELQKIIKRDARIISPNDSVILATRLRWLNWAPIYDGTWDFQNTLRIVLNNPNLKGTVITERLHVVRDSLVDSYQNSILESFRFDRMLICAPPFLLCNSPSNSRTWIHINSKEEFLKYVKLGAPNTFKYDLNCTCDHIRKYLRTSRQEIR